jgi:mannosyltransferase
MPESQLPPMEAHPGRASSSARWLQSGRTLAVCAILAVAAGLRFWQLGRTSLWYDEVVSMRVARSHSLPALMVCLDQIDGTRAPLHPILLQGWLRVLGPSDVAGRAFSALAGCLTVVVIYTFARRALGDSAGCWAAWLAAVSPSLVYYSREARMYAWLVLVTCLSWLAFLSFRQAARPAQAVLYGLLLVSLAYSHPVGLFMIAAHGLAYLLARSCLKLPFRWWLLMQLAVILAIVPWLRRYMDHGTDYPMPRYPIRFLLAAPIEYVGGNSIVLLACVAIIALGLLSRDEPSGRPVAVARPVETVAVVIWAVVPVVLIYLYSWVAQPIFGPARYHLFIGPAYLILLGQGLSTLPAVIRWPAAAGGLALSLSLLYSGSYGQFLKADWRSLGEWLKRHETATTSGDTLAKIRVVVHPSDPRFPREQLEAARYYLSRLCRVVSPGEAADDGGAIYDAYCLSSNRTTTQPVPGAQRFEGLVVQRRAAP